MPDPNPRGGLVTIPVLVFMFKPVLYFVYREVPGIT